jgi:hypothetical protein
MKLFFAAIWILATLMVAVLAIAGVDSTVRLYYSNALQLMSSLGCGMICLLVMDTFPAGSPLRNSWRFIGAGVMAWGAGATIFAGYPPLHGGEDTPYPYYADIGYLLTSPLITMGLLSFKRGAGLAAPTWGKILAVLVLLVSGCWGYYANREGLSGQGTAMTLTSLGYMLFDPVLLAMTVLTATSFSGGIVGETWWKVVIGVAFYFFANQAFTYLNLIDNYTTGSWIDMGWMLGFGCIAWAALTARKLMG